MDPVQQSSKLNHTKTTSITSYRGPWPSEACPTIIFILNCVLSKLISINIIASYKGPWPFESCLTAFFTESKQSASPVTRGHGPLQPVQQPSLFSSTLMVYFLLIETSQFKTIQQPSLFSSTLMVYFLLIETSQFKTIFNECFLCFLPKLFVKLRCCRFAEHSH